MARRKGEWTPYQVWVKNEDALLGHVQQQAQRLGLSVPGYLEWVARGVMQAQQGDMSLLRAALGEAVAVVTTPAAAPVEVAPESTPTPTAPEMPAAEVAQIVDDNDLLDSMMGEM